MATNRFKHFVTGKYICMDWWVKENTGEALLTPFDEAQSNASNSNFTYEIKDNNYSPDNSTTITSANWVKQLFWLILFPDDRDVVDYGQFIVAKALNPYFTPIKFYFKPTETIDGKSYYQICTLFKGHEYCVKIYNNPIGEDTNRYQVDLFINTPSQTDYDTYFSIEPAA